MSPWPESQLVRASGVDSPSGPSWRSALLTKAWTSPIGPPAVSLSAIRNVFYRNRCTPLGGYNNCCRDNDGWRLGHERLLQRGDGLEAPAGPAAGDGEPPAGRRGRAGHPVVVAEAGQES